MLNLRSTELANDSWRGISVVSPTLLYVTTSRSKRLNVVPECFCRESKNRFPLGACGNDKSGGLSFVLDASFHLI